MEYLKLSLRTWRIRSDKGVLGPTENGIHANFLRGDDGNGDVFRDVPEIENVRLNRQALAKILGIRLHNPVAAAVAGAQSRANSVTTPIGRIFFKDCTRWFDEWPMGIRRRNLVPNDAASMQRGLLVVFAASKPGNQTEAAKPFHQIGEMAAIFLVHGGEFQPQSPSGLHMPHHGFGPDLPLFDKEMEVGLRAHGLGRLGQDKQTAGAEIANLRSIVIRVRAPADIDGSRCPDTRAGPSGMRSLLFHGGLPQPSFPS